MFKETIVVGVVFVLIWVSTSNFQGRFFSKEANTFEGDFVNKTWLELQVERIKDELYERIRTEMSLEKESAVEILPSENRVTDHQSELEVNLTKLTETFSEDQTIIDTGDQIKDPGGPAGHGVDVGVNEEGHNVETGDLEKQDSVFTSIEISNLVSNTHNIMSTDCAASKYHGMKLHHNMSAAFDKMIAHSMRKYDSFWGHEQKLIAMSILIHRP